jgi:hypothetical protein
MVYINGRCPGGAEMNRFLTFIILSIVTLALIKLVLVVFDLGEMEWLIICLPILMLYYGSYGLTIPFVKSKDKE